MLELYHAAGSVCAQKVRFALALKGIDWGDRLMALDDSPQYKPEYLALNPKAVVPTLVHDGRVVRESSIICEYLEDVFPEPSLRPSDPIARAEMRRWAKIPDDEIHVACGFISQAGLLRQGRLVNPQPYYERIAKDPNRKRADRNRRMLENGFNEPDAKRGIFIHARLLKEMQGALGGGRPWLVGDALSLADVGLAPYINRLFVSGLAPMWADKPAVADWFRRVKALPAYREAFEKYIPRYGNEPVGEGIWPEVKPVLAAGEDEI
jgi:glutathione S-transferase